MAAKKVPGAASDALLHLKDSDRTERIVFPFTRYDNVLGSPGVIDDVTELTDAPFHLLKLEEETLTISQIRDLCGFIL